MRLWAVALLAARARASIDCSGGETVLSAPSYFGVGGLDIVSEGESSLSYADNENHCWRIEPAAGGATALTVLFDLFQTEHSHDFVTVYDAATADDAEPAVLWRESGELVTPYVAHFASAGAVVVQFEADGTYRHSAETMQLGFNATWFDASDGSCANACSGHGSCASGVCDCDDDYGPDTTGDCSVATPLMVNNEANSVTIRALEVGGWAYAKISLDRTRNFVLEMVDVGLASSDPKLMLNPATGGGTHGLPTLSNYRFTDWFDWYYDCADLHYIRGTMTAGTYYVGVTNDVNRATSPLSANLTFRTANTANIPCLLDCNGHGTCDTSTGDCVCDDGWAGAIVNAPDTCTFEIRELTLDAPLHSSAAGGALRIGAWDYYVLEVQPHQAHARTLFVSFESHSPHAYPVLLVRRGEVPRLWEHFVPTYDAFNKDFGDEDGFNLLRGQRQTVTVNATDLTAGTYYVGVYNIWGHNVDGQWNSEDSCEYTLYANLYAAGKPCPLVLHSSGLVADDIAHADDGEPVFCAGAGSCDYNTGVCDCPAERLLEDCSVLSTELVPGAAATHDTLAVDEAHYYRVHVGADDVAGRNLRVELELDSVDSCPRGGCVFLIGRFEGVPYPFDFSTYDEHDLVANFRGQSTHALLVDAEELAARGAGEWFVGVQHAGGSDQPVSYTLTAELAASVACPVSALNGLECAGEGACVGALGRCDCDAGNVLDDCSADGVYYLRNADNTGATSARDSPPIAVDDWAFWSFAVGCEGREVEVHFETVDDGSAPLLVMRRGLLPLMIVGTYDYWDYYTGETAHAAAQAVHIRPCESTGCYLHPGSPGTIFSTGSPEPGIYYVGVYNDKHLADQPIRNYTLSFAISGSCAADASGAATCADGFVGAECEVVCPGKMPEDVYSNSPVDTSTYCSGHGACALADAGDAASCSCAEGYHGDTCEVACPFGDDGAGASAPCAGRGSCSYDASAATATCACDEGFLGDACELPCAGYEGAPLPAAPCSGAGECVLATAAGDDGAATACACDAGRLGDACEYACPATAGGDVCAGSGVCSLTTHGSTGLVEAVCECEAGHLGATCDVVCDGDATCSGHGACEQQHAVDAAGDVVGVRCACADGWVGDSCGIACPGLDAATGAGRACSGNGTCAASGAASAACHCFSGHAGDVCEELVEPETIIQIVNGTVTTVIEDAPADDPSKGGHFFSSLVIGLVGAAILLLAIVIAIVIVISERRKRTIRRYERLVREVGTTSTTILARANPTLEEDGGGGGASNYVAPDRTGGNVEVPTFDELRGVKKVVNSPFHDDGIEL